MEIQTTHYNPFVLSTANAAWQDPESSPLNRVINTTSGVLYDVYVKNPFDIINSNANCFSSSQTTSAKISHFTVSLIGAFYSLMLYGSTFYLAGLSLSALGTKVGFSFLTKASYPIQTVGKNLFFAGALPVYGVVYALPKYIIKAIPKAAQSIAIKVHTIYQWTLKNILTPIWDTVIHPLLQEITKVICYIKNAAIKVVQVIAQQITQIADWVFQHILQPIWSHLIEPIINFTNKAISTLVTKLGNTIQCIADKISLLAHWIFQNLLTPCFNAISEAFNAAGKAILNHIILPIGQALQFLANQTSLLAHWIFQNLLTPLFNAISDAFTAAGKAILNHIILPIGQALQFLANQTSLLAHWIFQNLLTPLFNAISEAFNTVSKAILDYVILPVSQFLLNYVILPVGQGLHFVAQTISSFAQGMFNNLISPLAQAIANGFVIIGGNISAITNDVLNGIYASWINLFPKPASP